MVPSLTAPPSDPVKYVVFTYLTQKMEARKPRILRVLGLQKASKMTLPPPHGQDRLDYPRVELCQARSLADELAHFWRP